MTIKKFLTIILLFSLGFSINAFSEERMSETPSPEEAETMPEETMVNERMEEEDIKVRFSGDFAGSYSVLSSEEDPHGDMDVSLTQFNVKAGTAHSKVKVGFGYGSTFRDISEGTNRLGLLNAFYKMKTSHGLTFMMGRFESPVGHETYNHRRNSQFTRSYGFNLAPYFSTGVGVKYGQDMWRVGLLVTNGRGADTDLEDDKTFAVVLDLAPMKNIHIDLNYVMGTEGDGSLPTTPSETDENIVPVSLSSYSISIIDLSVSYMINDMFNVALNYISNTSTPEGSEAINSSSLAAYVNAKYKIFDFGLRYELFNFNLVQRGSTSAGLYYNGSGLGLTGQAEDNSINSITLNAKAGIAQNANVILEYRMDSADDGNTFLTADGDSTDFFDRMTLGLMYNF